MMKTLFTTAAAAIGLVMVAASSASAATWAECDYAARQYAVQNTNPGGAAVGTAVLGGLLGLGISSVTGNTNTAGAVALGAGAGAVTGFVASNAKMKQLYDSYMASCLGGSPQPQPIYAPQPQPGTIYPAPGPQAGVYQSLNVRVCPAATPQCPSIGTIQPGSVVPVQGCNSPTPGVGWCQVGIPQGWGWASKKYLYF